MADLKQSSSAELREVLQMVFNRTPDWWDSQETKNRHEKIRNDPIFKIKVEGYTDRVTKEEDRYLPFCELANHIISLLCAGAQKAPLVIVRNDRVMVLGSAATRFPDCVAVNPIALEDSRGGGAEKLAKEGPTELPFAWQELLTFIEFKLDKKYLGKILEGELNKLASSQDEQGTQSGSLMSAAPIIPGEVKQGRRDLWLKWSSSLSLTDRANIIGATTAKRQPDGSPISPQEQRKRLKTQPQPDIEQDPERKPSRAPSSESEGGDVNNSDTLEDQDDGDSDYLPGGIVKKMKREQEKEQKEPQTRVNHSIQCASYALELMSHTSPSTHRVGFLVNDDKIQIQYYDRSRVVVSPEVSFIENRAVLIEILDCLTSATPMQWGFLEGITPPDPQEIPRFYTRNNAKFSYLSLSTFTCENNAVLKLDKVIFRHHAIIGRGTCVVSARSDYLGWKGRALVVKISFTPDTRPAERYYLNEIRKLAVQDKNEDILDHFPEMLLFQKFPSSATAVQDRVHEHFKKLSELGEGGKVEYEMRNVQLLVMTRLKSVKSLDQGIDVKEVLKGVVKGYIWLCKTATLLHRDISVENIMYRHKQGKICGVLNDFDLAIFTSEQANSPLSRQRTGTRPYMATELLGFGPIPCRHLYRHDLESIMYVTMVLACFRLASAEDQRNSEIMHWFNPKATEYDIRKSKREFLLGETGGPAVTSTMTGLERIVDDLYDLFREGLVVRIQASGSRNRAQILDEETINGAITVEKFAQIFGL